jgi:hypothetical protein
MGSEYSADPAQIRASVTAIDAIAALVLEIGHDFERDVKLTDDWPGEDDTFARETIPRVRKEQEGSVRTAESMFGVLLAAARGTVENLKNIEGTQAQNIGAIHDSAGGKRGGGRH